MSVRFGPFVLDPEARELRCDGSPLHLSPKAFQLLAALVESRPKALSKANLHDRLWPDTFVVEANLANLEDLLDDPRLPEPSHPSRRLPKRSRAGYICELARSSSLSKFLVWISDLGS